MKTLLLFLTICSLAFGGFLDKYYTNDDFSWCVETGQEVFVADFNGDGRADLLCHDNCDGAVIISYGMDPYGFKKDDWTGHLAFCAVPHSSVLVADFNGDGRADLLCYEDGLGYVWQRFATKTGTFTDIPDDKDHYPYDICVEAVEDMYVGDVNADGRADMVCHDRATGSVKVAHAKTNGIFYTVQVWENAIMFWCIGFQMNLFLGDFNGDKRSDMLCHLRDTGALWTAFANAEGYFDTDSEQELTFCAGPSSILAIGDYNGDEYDDLLCQDTRTRSISLGLFDGTFSRPTWSENTLWCTDTQWFNVADFNGDNYSDIMCRDSRHLWLRITTIG